MKILSRILFLVILSTCFFACNDSDDDAPNGASDLGTFAGSIQISDDPFTQLGYLSNVKVTVSRNGSTATIKIIGDPQFDREYTGTITSQSTNTYIIALKKQTKPQEKIVGDQLVIMDNKLTLTVDVANDAVTAKANPTATGTIQISGKLKMIGTDMLRQ